MRIILEPGWVLCAMNDKAHRRGLWYRETRGPDGKHTKLEVCGGREGDDWYVELTAGEMLDPRKLYDLFLCLETGAAMVYDYYVEPKD